jgi:dsDNA-specific endonuclease/ATPase MutS2
MSKDGDVKDIITQLQNLHIQQATLILRLEHLSEEGDNASGPKAPTGTTRAFEIGDQVRIRNPRRLQAVRGKIVRIIASRITIEVKNGTTIVRAPKNLYFDNE